MPGDPWATAQANVGLKYDPQQAAIERAMQQGLAGTAANEAALQGYGTTGRGVIGETYGTLYGLLGQSRQQQGADLSRQVGLTNQGYDTAYGNIQQQGNESANYLNQMAAQLGQQGAGLRANTDLANVINSSLGRVGEAKARYGGNLSDWAAKMDVFAGQGIDQAHQAESLRKSEFETQLLKLLGSNKLEGQLEQNEWSGKLSDILGMRQNDLIAMYQELAQQEWENQMQQAALDAENARHAAGLAAQREIAAMQESGANSRAAAGKDDSLAWAQFEYQKLKDRDDATLTREELALKYAAEAPGDDREKNLREWLAGGRDINSFVQNEKDIQSYLAGTYGQGAAPPPKSSSKSWGGLGGMFSSPGKAAVTVASSTNPIGYAYNLFRGLRG